MEIDDLDIIYIWENDSTLWEYGDTRTPYSRCELVRFIEEQQNILMHEGQLRLVICTPEDEGVAVGLIDIFEYDHIHRRAGVGITIDPAHQRMGYASDALLAVERYLHTTLNIHQLWCNIGATNSGSIALFEGCGYKSIGVKKDWRVRGEEYFNEIMFQKILLKGRNKTPLNSSHQ